jgi:hypothetical protein
VDFDPALAYVVIVEGIVEITIDLVRVRNQAEFRVRIAHDVHERVGEQLTVNTCGFINKHEVVALVDTTRTRWVILLG